MGRTVAVVNQKGGVGKTTTAVSLAAALATAGRSVLLVDADPQANATRALGFPADPTRPSLYHVLSGLASFDEARLAVEALPQLTLLPSDRNLVGAEVELVNQPGREYRLKQLLDSPRAEFETTLIDCPPSLALLTVNGLAAADAVLVPVQCEYLALEGISQLMETIRSIREALNPELQIDGLVMTMYDDRTNLSRQVVEEVREVFRDQVYQTVIPRNVRVSEAPSHGLPILLYEPRSRGAEAYLNLAQEFLKRKEFSTHETQGLGKGASEPDPRSTEAHATTPAEPSAGGDAPSDRHRPDQP